MELFIKVFRAAPIFLAFILSVFCTDAYSADEIRIFKPQSEKDQRQEYFDHLLVEALNITEAEHGPYKVRFTIPSPGRDAALTELIKGDRVNVALVPTKPEWEAKALPIYIPLLKGLLGYRLFLVNENKLDSFTNISTVEELKKLKAGLRQGWSITEALEKKGFTVEKGNKYEGLFGMLARDRFDYFPRGVNEIYKEYDARKGSFPNMKIEPTMALYIPLAWHAFVSPEYPKLQARIELGLNKLIEKGDFEALFKEYNQSYIEQANLKNRRILKVDNPSLSGKSTKVKSDMWLSLEG